LTNSETNAILCIQISMPAISENLVKIGFVVSEISFLQAIVKKKKKERK